MNLHDGTRNFTRFNFKKTKGGDGVTELYDLLISLIRSEAYGVPLAEVNADEQTIGRIYRLSAMHDLAHLAGKALMRTGIDMPEDITAGFKTALSTALFRYLKINTELKSLSNTFEEAKIDFMPLKGSVLRYLYREPWMRTSCDIDVLVKEEDAERAVNLLVEELGFDKRERASHDISLFSPSGVHVELHFRLLEDSVKDDFFSNAWQDVHLADGCEHKYAMSDDMFYAYHIAHMAKHFGNGGCGIRPFLDIAFLTEKMTFTKKKDDYLEKCKLSTFAHEAETLARAWFGGGEHTELTRAMEKFVIGGGVYGTLENYVAIKQAKSGGKIKYLFSRVFVPYSILKGTYPRLEKYPFLLPYYQAKRLFGYIFRKDKSRLKHELGYNNSVSSEKKDELLELMQTLDLV